MTITVDIRPEVEAELARQAAAQGLAIEAVAAALLEDAVHLSGSTARPIDDAQARARAAAERIRELRQGVTLDRPAGMSLREYAHIGHRY